jgi:hypothetical protein
MAAWLPLRAWPRQPPDGDVLDYREHPVPLGPQHCQGVLRLDHEQARRAPAAQYLVQALLAFGTEPSESFGPFCQGIRGLLLASPSRSVGRGSTQPARAIAPRCRTAILD